MFQTLGIHHVTAIVGDPQENLDFYTQVLGLRLVKLTVNYDDPGTYHFYFGDALGRPGTIMTTFPWPGARKGQVGTGQVTTTSYAIGTDSVDYWLDRLRGAGVSVQDPIERFGELVISFEDPHGLNIELIATGDGSSGDPDDTSDHGVDGTWEHSPVPADHQLTFFHSVTLSVREPAATAQVLEFLGFETEREDPDRWRMRVKTPAGGGAVVDLVERSGGFGNMSAGTVHHVAIRIASDEEQERLRDELVRRGFRVSGVMDRSYFRSIYFREPNGVLFEVATDPPGFSVDEPLERLGTELCLPQRLEPSRSLIEQALPSLKLPTA